MHTYKVKKQRYGVFTYQRQKRGIALALLSPPSFLTVIMSQPQLSALCKHICTSAICLLFLL